MNKQTKNILIIAVLLLQSIFVNAQFDYYGYPSSRGHVVRVFKEIAGKLKV